MATLKPSVGGAHPPATWKPPAPPAHPHLPPPLRPTKAVRTHGFVPPGALPPPPKPVYPLPEEFTATQQAPPLSVEQAPPIKPLTTQQHGNQDPQESPKAPPITSAPKQALPSNPYKMFYTEQASTANASRKVDPLSPTLPKNSGEKATSAEQVPPAQTSTNDQAVRNQHPSPLAPLLSPPEDIANRVAQFHRYRPGERQRTIQLLSEDPQTLKLPLACWLQKVQKEGRASNRTYNNLLFCERGIKVAEFVALFRADNFTDALTAALESPSQNSPSAYTSKPKSGVQTAAVPISENTQNALQPTQHTKIPIAEQTTQSGSFITTSAACEGPSTKSPELPTNRSQTDSGTLGNMQNLSRTFTLFDHYNVIGKMKTAAPPASAARKSSPPSAHISPQNIPRSPDEDCAVSSPEPPSNPIQPAPPAGSHEPEGYFQQLPN